jgi:competence protein ComEA
MREVRFGVATLLAAALLASPVVAQQPQGSAPEKAAQAVVNINTATAEQLETLPGIGATTAARIVEYRQKNGGFKKVEELMNVRGVGEKNFLKIKHLVSAAPARADKGGTQR